VVHFPTIYLKAFDNVALLNRLWSSMLTKLGYFMRLAILMAVHLLARKWYTTMEVMTTARYA
jgi:hypothetical protein